MVYPEERASILPSGKIRCRGKREPITQTSLAKPSSRNTKGFLNEHPWEFAATTERRPKLVRLFGLGRLQVLDAPTPAVRCGGGRPHEPIYINTNKPGRIDGAGGILSVAKPSNALACGIYV